MGKKEVDLSRITAKGENVLRSIARLQLSPESVERSIVVLCTLAEVHTGVLLDTLISLESNSRTRLDEALLERTREGMYSSWSTMFDWLKVGFGINIMGDRTVQDFMICVDLRNAVVHGNSSLTRMQTKKFESSALMRRNMERVLRVSFVGNMAQCDDETKFAAISITRDYILHVDATILDEYPSMLGRV